MVVGYHYVVVGSSDYHVVITTWCETDIVGSQTDIVGSQTTLQRLTRYVARILKSLLGGIHGAKRFLAGLLRRSLHSWIRSPPPAQIRAYRIYSIKILL